MGSVEKLLRGRGAANGRVATGGHSGNARPLLRPGNRNGGSGQLQHVARRFWSRMSLLSITYSMHDALTRVTLFNPFRRRAKSLALALTLSSPPAMVKNRCLGTQVFRPIATCTQV